MVFGIIYINLHVIISKQNDKLEDLDNKTTDAIDEDVKAKEPKQNRKSTKILILGSFSKDILEQRNLIERMISQLLIEYQKHREKQNIDESTLHSLGKMLVELTEVEGNVLYDKYFEKRFLDNTSEFYSTYANNILAKSDINLFNYCELVENQLNHEKNQYFYLKRSTRDQITSIVQEQLVSRHYVDLLNRNPGGFNSIVESKDTRDVQLRKVYDVFHSTLDAKKDLYSHYHDYVKKESADLIGNEKEWEKPIVWAQNYLTLYSDNCETVRFSFRWDNDFDTQRINAFRDSLKGKTAPCTALALNLDSKLREKAGTLSNDQQKVLIETTLDVFELLDDKDVFKNEYEKCLKKRLLDNKVMSEDFESRILTGLTDKAGKSFTETSYQIQQEYKNEHENSKNKFALSGCSIDFNPTILTEGTWKFESIPAIGSAPAFFANIYKRYETSYNNNNGNKKIRPIYSEGSVKAVVTYPSGKRYDVTFTTPQAFIVEMIKSGINTRESIMSNLKVDQTKYKSDFLSQIQSFLACKKKSEPTFLLEDSSSVDKNKRVISFNMNYINPRNKFSIPIPTVKHKVAQTVSDDLKQQRWHQMDAAIVRVMKIRGVLHINQLQASVVDLLARFFAPTPSDIKKRIDDLIERDYLSRDDNDNSTFHYVA